MKNAYRYESSGDRRSRRSRPHDSRGRSVERDGAGRYARGSHRAQRSTRTVLSHGVVWGVAELGRGLAALPLLARRISLLALPHSLLRAPRAGVAAGAAPARARGGAAACFRALGAHEVVVVDEAARAALVAPLAHVG